MIIIQGKEFQYSIQLLTYALQYQLFMVQLLLFFVDFIQIVSINYKIIEKIISRGAYTNTKDIKDIREDSPKDRPKEQIELKDQIETDIKDNLIEVKEDTDDKKMLDDDKEKEDNLKPLFRIPKFHFYDFLYNNVYFDCCKPSTTQGVISACNDLISKYYSIDAVIYNQLRLENLFRDYKWNNPQLNSIGNNDIMAQIKALSHNLTGS